MAVGVLLLAGCASGSAAAKKHELVCHSIQVKPIILDKVLLGHHLPVDYPVRSFTPFRLVSSKLGSTPDEALGLRNPLFAWYRYGNTAYLVMTLVLPIRSYVAAKACDWKQDSVQLKGPAKPLGQTPSGFGWNG
jgi:hypothetical protein